MIMVDTFPCEDIHGLVSGFLCEREADIIISITINQSGGQQQYDSFQNLKTRKMSVSKEYARTKTGVKAENAKVPKKCRFVNVHPGRKVVIVAHPRAVPTPSVCRNTLPLTPRQELIPIRDQPPPSPSARANLVEALINSAIIASAIKSKRILSRTIVALIFVLDLRNHIFDLPEQTFRSSSLACMRTAASESADTATARAPEAVFGDLGFREGAHAEESGVDAAVGSVEKHCAGGIDGRNGFRLDAVGDVDRGWMRMCSR
jgi:hypothetical protein